MATRSVRQLTARSAQSDPKPAALAWLDANASTLSRVNRNIWGWAETGLEEVKSSKELQDLLSANGFTVRPAWPACRPRSWRRYGPASR